MNDISNNSEASEFRAESLSLWRITFGPLIWALHFVASYGAAAVVCAKWAQHPAIVEALRIGIGSGTVAALVGILWLGWRAWVQWDTIRDRDWENDASTDEDRHQFLGNAAFLLAIISFIGVCYVALPVLLIGTCR